MSSTPVSLCSAPGWKSVFQPDLLPTPHILLKVTTGGGGGASEELRIQRGLRVTLNLFILFFIFF